MQAVKIEDACLFRRIVWNPRASRSRSCPRSNAGRTSPASSPSSRSQQPSARSRASGLSRREC